MTAGQMLPVGNRASEPAVLAQDPSADVPMFRGNAARTGEMHGPDPDDSNGVEVIWTFTVDNDTTDDTYATSSSAVVDGVVYVGSGDSKLYAVNAAEGTERWRFATGDGVYSSPVVLNGVVYVGSTDGNLYAIGARVPRLGIGGTTRVKEKTLLRGGPAPTAIERAELQADTVVTITGEPVTTDGITWWLVTVDASGAQGWFEASTLEPLASGPEPAATP